MIKESMYIGKVIIYEHKDNFKDWIKKEFSL